MMIITDAALPGLNDVYYDNVYTSADVRVVGYIVEFGYDEQEDPGGRTNQDTKVCDITLADDDSTVVIARTGHSLTFRGMPHIDYKVEKDGISYTVTERENEPGVYDVTGLDKNTTYNIDGDILFGDTTGTTLPIDAKDIAKAFDTDNTTEKDAKTDAASNSNVEVSVGEDGNYKVVVKKNINKTIEVPDTWGTVNIDLNGKTIEGAKATEGADAQPGIKFVQGDGSSHPGTDLIISNGTIKGGDGIPSHPNGAAGVTADGVTPGLTVRKDATIKGGNGADATMGNGGNGGAGISGNITTTVDGTVIGGQGGNGAPGTQPGNGGTGGAGIDSTGSTTVEPTGKVTGGQGGNGGAGNGTQGGTGGNGGAGSTGTTTNQGVINGGAGGNGGSNGGQGGNGGGAGTDDGANITNDGGTKSNGADGQINNGSLDSTTTTVIVKDPTNGLIYKIFDENGKEIEGITDAQVRTGAGEDLTFTGLTPNTWYTVKAFQKNDAGELEPKDFAGDGKIQTKPQNSGGHHSSSTVSKNFTITATAGNGGSISPSGKTTVAEGGSKSFTITVNDGYEIADVLVDGASIGTKTSYTFEKVSASHTIEVKFRKVEQVLIVTDPSITGVANWLETDDHVVYLHGYPDRSFRPENPMTRAEAAQMFYNLLLNKDVEKTKFTDVADDAWYATAVETLASIGVIKGVGNDQFAPERAITRAEFAAIATRFAKVDDSGSVNFKDVKTGDWFYDAVETAVSYGWINGYTDSTFRPANTITRTEVSAIVNRMLARAGDTAYARMHGDVMKHFTDVTDSFWGYSNIIEATNQHDYTKTDGVENWK